MILFGGNRENQKQTQNLATSFSEAPRKAPPEGPCYPVFQLLLPIQTGIRIEAPAPWAETEPGANDLTQLRHKNFWKTPPRILVQRQIPSKAPGENQLTAGRELLELLAGDPLFWAVGALQPVVVVLMGFGFGL